MRTELRGRGGVRDRERRGREYEEKQTERGTEKHKYSKTWWEPAHGINHGKDKNTKTGFFIRRQGIGGKRRGGNGIFWMVYSCQKWYYFVLMTTHSGILQKIFKNQDWVDFYKHSYSILERQLVTAPKGELWCFPISQGPIVSMRW